MIILIPLSDCGRPVQDQPYPAVYSNEYPDTQTPSVGLRSGAYAGNRTMVSQSRAAIRVRIRTLTWVLRLSQTSTIGAFSRWWAWSRNAM